MSLDKVNLAKAYEIWSDFKEEVLYKNRFIVNHEVLDHLKHLTKYNQMVIEKNSILYRARVFTGDSSYIPYLNSGLSDKELDATSQPLVPMPASFHPIKSRQLSGFWGYDEEDSYVPSNNDLISDGRVNPAFIKYLYTAEDPYTALVEVRPYLGCQVSVAEIKVNEALTVADFSYDSIEKLQGFEEYLMYFIMSDFSKPSDSDKKSYIPSQYVAEYIKTAFGMDGIKFNSSLHGRGRNITIFNYDKCKPIGSKLYKVDDICFEAKAIAPLKENDLIHWKLQFYKEKTPFELFRLIKMQEHQ